MDNSEGLLDITVVIPYYNESKTILTTIDLVSKQTKMPVAIIFVNSTSTDSSSDLINNWIAENQSKYTTKFYNLFEETNTPSSSKNVGIRNTKTEWIAFMDCGQRFELNWLEKQWRFHNENPEFDIISGCCFLEGEGLVDACAVAQTYGYKRCCPTVPSTLVKKSIFDRHGLFLENRRAGYDMEWQLMLRIKGIKRGVNNEVVFRYIGKNFGATISGIFRKSILYAVPTMKMPYYRTPYYYLLLLTVGVITLLINPHFFFPWAILYIAFRGYYIPSVKSQGLTILFHDHPLARFFLPIMGIVIDSGRLIGILKGVYYYHILGQH